MQVDDPEVFLKDSGLLFHLNLNIFHPLGLALALEIEEDTKHGIATSRIVVHETEDPKGYVFGEEDMTRSTQLFTEFMKERKQRVLSRNKLLGYIVQPTSDDE